MVIYPKYRFFCFFITCNIIQEMTSVYENTFQIKNMHVRQNINPTCSITIITNNKTRQVWKVKTKTSPAIAVDSKAMQAQ